MSLRSFVRSSQCCRLPVRILSRTQRSICTLIANEGAISLRIHADLWSAHFTPPISSSRSRSFSLPPSSPPIKLVDPSRPSLFYHLLPAPNPLSKDLPVYGVSILDRPPRNGNSPSIMGWLPAAVSGRPGEEAVLGDFKENGQFLDVLHHVIHKALEDGTDERLKSEAIQLNEGWMHINDDRNLPPMGRISNPDDIIGSVRVEGGVILPNTYTPMPTYRICTTDGLTTLSEGLERRLLDKLRQMES